MRKRIAVVAAACVLALTLAACGSTSGASSAASGSGVSGTFSGTAQGMGGDVTVTLTLENGVITDCTAEGANETDGIGTLALDQLPGDIVANNSVGVDGVASATITSDAIKAAASAALEEAGLNPADFGGTSAE